MNVEENRARNGVTDYPESRNKDIMFWNCFAVREGFVSPSSRYAKNPKYLRSRIASRKHKNSILFELQFHHKPLNRIFAIKTQFRSYQNVRIEPGIVSTRPDRSISATGEEEVAHDFTPFIVTLTNEWNEFLGTYFHHSSTSSSSSSDNTGAAIEIEQELTINLSMEPKSPVGIQQSPSGTKSPSETAAQVAMEEPIQEQPSISMEPVSPSGTMADEDLSSYPELSVDATKEFSKLVGQLEEAVNAKVNSEAAAASEGPVILDDSSTEELFADEPTVEPIGSISSGVKTIDKGKRKLTPEEEAEQEERRPKIKKGRPDTSLDDEMIRLIGLL
ncbi:hypothetical protein E3N88_25672 [Mikania micrantha]|uniref:Uncharacterized protein n=1 Tax=Mikania micrantha TaxID=192012 RepID=A0A5N6N5J9_9ASTR|nr:hypothetical protein E3N88_25672 [Mikania micrantha]